MMLIKKEKKALENIQMVVHNKLIYHTETLLSNELKKKG